MSASGGATRARWWRSHPGGSLEPPFPPSTGKRRALLIASDTCSSTYFRTFQPSESASLSWRIAHRLAEAVAGEATLDATAFDPNVTLDGLRSCPKVQKP